MKTKLLYLIPIILMSFSLFSCGDKSCKKGCNWDKGIIIKNATCEESGEVKYTCFDCEATKIDTIDPIGHNIVTDNAVAATCYKSGLTEGSHCENCGHVYLEQQVIDKVDHNWQEERIVKEASCIVDGIKEIKCSYCKRTKYEYIKATGHTEIVDEAIQETCSNTGLTEGSHCAKCKEILIKQEIIEKLAHTLENDRCIKCDYLNPEVYGLEYKLSKDGSYYSVVGMGVATSNRIIILEEYSGLPVKTIEDNAFYKCRSLISIIIPNSVTSIGSSAFGGCSSLESITVPDGITSIGYGAFTGCSSLESITLPFVGNTLNGTTNTHFGYIFGASSFAYNDDYVPTSLKEVMITGGTSIDSSAFRYCNSLENIIIPNSVISIGWGAFNDCISLESITLPFVGNTLDGITNTSFEYIFGSVPSSLKKLIVTGGSSIEASAFSECSNLTNIEIPESVTSIGASAFSECSNLTNIEIPESVTTIGASAFSGCINLTSIKIPKSVTSIEKHTFSGCSSLASIVISNGVIRIGEKAFEGCSSLTSVYYNGTIENWCNVEFNNGYSNPMSYAEHFFMKNSNNEYYEVIEMEIPNTVTSIGDYQFFGFINMTSVTIRENVTNIGYSSFYECNNLINVYYEGTLEDWCNIEFSNEYSNPMSYAKQFYMKDSNNEYYEVTEIKIPNTITSIGNYQFYGFDNLIKVTIPDTGTSIGDNAFAGCINMKSIIVPESVTSIDKSSFEKCGNLIIYCESESQPEGWENNWNSSVRLIYRGINEKNFYEENGIQYVLKMDKITASVTRYVGSDAEVEITSTIKVNDVEYSVTSIGDYAFSGCSGLESIVIPDSITSIGEIIFFNCSGLRNITVDSNNKYYKSIDGNLYTKNGKSLYQYAIGKKETFFQVPSSVTSIGYKAFYGCGSLESIVIPDSVTSIGSSAFSECSNLESIIIPDSVTSIEECTFSGCSSLTSIVIPNSVTSIGSSVFSGCSNLESIIIPDSVTSIEECTFSGCSSLTSIVIPNSVTSIGSSTFSGCSSLTNIEIPEDVKIISSKAFLNCSSLTNVSLPHGVKNIGSSAFSGCSSLESIVIPNSVTSIESSAFSGCSSLESIVIPNSVTSIESSVFFYCSSLESIVIPNGVTSIGVHAFYNCSSLTNVEIPSSVTSIGSSAFYECSSLENVYYNGTLEDWCNIKFSYYSNPMYYAEHFYMLDSNNEYYEVTEIEIPNTVTSIGDYQFDSFDNITKIIIPNSVTSIGYDAFSGCSSLESISLPYISTAFGYIFGAGSYWYNDDCVPTSLKEVIITGGSSIGEYAFSGCRSLESIVIPNSVTSIGSSAFSGCRSLESIVIPDSVTSIGKYVFSYCSNLTIYCEATSKPNGWDSQWNSDNRPVYWGINESNFYEENGMQYVLNLETKEATITKYVGNDINLVIKSSITINDVEYSLASIEKYAFSRCSSLINVEIPNSITSIGKYAFYECSSLESMTLPFIGNKLDGTTNTHFGYIFGESSYFDYSRYVPTSLKEVIITGGTSIGEYAFYNCSSLKSIVIPASVIRIGSSAFFGCSTLTIYCEATSEPSEWSSNWNDDTPVYWGINETNFYEENEIQYVLNLETKEATIARWYANGFHAEIKTSILVNNVEYSVTSIGTYAFSNCSSLTSIVISNSVTSIGAGAFSNCSSLTSIVISNSVTSIGAYAFNKCSSLKSINIPDSVTSIGEDVFSWCSSLTIYCRATSKPDGWDYYWHSGRQVYWGINETNFYEENGIQYVLNLKTKKAIVSKYVGNDANVVINENIIVNDIEYSVRSIGAYAFYGCSSLESTVIPDSVTSIGEYAFNDCSSLESIVIPDSVTSIGDNTFSWCSSLERIVIPDSVTNVGACAFSSCSSLESIVIPDSVTSIGIWAFSGCSSLTIYCEAIQQPSGWDYNWNSDNSPVVWGYNVNEENE